MSKNTRDILIIVSISLLVILLITGFLMYKNKEKEEVVHTSGNNISNDNTEIQENILTETEQENIEKDTQEEEEEKTEEKENEELENKKDTENKDTITNTNKDNNNSSNNQNSTSGGTTNTVKKLSEPQNVKWSESKIGLVTWSPVQHADEYSVEIFKDGTNIGAGRSTETSCEIEGLIKQHGAGTYTVKIKAHSKALLSSDEVTTTYTV